MGATTQNSLPWREIAGFSWAANSSTLRRSGLDKAPNATLPLLAAIIRCSAQDRQQHTHIHFRVNFSDVRCSFSGHKKFLFSSL